MAGLGDEFRAAREARRLSLSDVSEHIHIRSIYLQSLEDEDWKAIAAPVYVRGFIRTYARFLGLDPEHAVAQFNAELGDGEKAAEPLAVAGAKARRPSFALWAAVVIAVLLVGFVGYSYYEFQESDRGSLSTGGDEPAASNPRAGSAGNGAAAAGVTANAGAPAHGRAAAGPSRVARAAPRKHTGSHLEIRVTQRSYIRVDVDGRKALEGIFAPGTTKEFNGSKNIAIRVGNAGGVDLRLNGRDLGPMGTPGAVVDRSIPVAAE